MRALQFILIASLASVFSTTASAQFSISGPGGVIPGSGTGSGGGGTWQTMQPGFETTSSVVVASAVTSIDSVVITGFTHTWAGDIQAVLVDPSLAEHNLILRPGYLNVSAAGLQGDFIGDYTIVSPGTAGALVFPTVDGLIDVAPGTYEQQFDTGGSAWVSGQNNIFNTHMGTLTGPAGGTWSLRIYDWAGGDLGSFTSWTLNGNGGTGSAAGAPGCDCAGTGNPSCFNVSAAATGCPNSVGGGVKLTGAGLPNTAPGMDTFSLSATGGVPGNFGLVLSGTVANSANFTIPNSAGGLCSGGTTQRGDVYAFDGAGNVSLPTFDLAVGGGLYGAASGPGFQTYQFWYRDPGGAAGCATDTAGADFNFSNGWDVTWM